MSGVLLATIPSPVRASNPNLGLLYLASALRRAGIEVRILDLASLYRPGDVDTLIAALDDQRPEVLGLTLYTETALFAYDLLAALGDRPGLCVVAGGPHVSAEPAEALERGVDVVVVGEGEQTLVELVGALRAGGDRAGVPGLAWRDGAGALRSSPPRMLPVELDRLPGPLDVLDLCEHDRYVEDGGPIFPAIITSRGCPGRCTFCANHVSGRRYRFHSADRVLDEVRGWQQREGATTVFFQDTAFTARRAHTLALCRRLAALSPPIAWVCKARCDQIDPELAGAMREAGCTSVFFGAESGSAAILRRTRKGIRVRDIERSAEVAHAAGLLAYVHLMAGFPDETAADLDATAALMDRLAPHVAGFPTGGVLLPYPGTEIYAEHHERFGCTGWWLDRWRIDALNVPVRGAGGAAPAGIDGVIALHVAVEEGLLAAKLVPYPPEIRAAIERCLETRRAWNRRLMERATTCDQGLSRR